MADQRLLDQLKRHEGAKRDAAGNHRAYRCSAGALTIGYGHNLDANPVPGVGAGSRLTEDQAERLLEADAARCRREMDAALPWAGKLSGPRYAVLLNMAFNMGLGSAASGRGLLGFKNTLEMVRKGNYSGAAKNMLASRWAAQVGNRAGELAKQMETGVWQ